jgi:hypothetical protein
MTTSPIPAGMTRALAGSTFAWLADQLPPILTTIRTETGRDLDVRLVRAGERLGQTRTLPADHPPLLEVRRRDRLSVALRLGGDVVAVWDLTVFLTSPQDCWQVLEDGMTYACPPEQLHVLFDAVTDAVTDAVAGRQPASG